MIEERIPLDLVRTPKKSPKGKMFIAAYQLGANDAELQINLWDIPDSVYIYYEDSTTSSLLVEHKLQTGPKKFILQKEADKLKIGLDLAGKYIYIYIIGNSNRKTKSTDWHYRFFNTNGRIIGYSNGFDWFRNQDGEHVINWGKRRNPWRDK